MELNESFESQINRSDYKILIVDDVMSNVLLLKILLTNEKFQVCTANNGNMCIEQAKKEKPDLILLDVMMPDISGFDTAVILKKDPETLDI
ncbi:MAG: response regulator, partial [Prevotella sp.]|nr:response regulator [Prevotella sp.]